MRAPLTHIVLFLSLYFTANIVSAQNYESSRNALRFAQTDTARANICVALGDHFLNQDKDSSYYYYDLALLTLELYSPTNNENKVKATKLKALVYRRLGTLFYYNKSFDKAQDYYSQSLIVSKVIPDYENIAFCYNNIGLVFESKGIYDQAISYYLKALQLGEKENMENVMAMCYNNLGDLEWKQQNTQKARDYFVKSIDLYTKLNDTKGIAMSLNNLGLIFEHVSMHKKALNSYQESLALYVQLDDLEGISSNHINIGKIYLKNFQINQALKHFDEAAKSVERLGDKTKEAIFYENLSSIYLFIADSVKTSSNKEYNNRIQEAINYGIKAYQLTKEIGDLNGNLSACHILKNAYYLNEEYDLALKYADEYIETEELLFSREKTNALAEMNTRFETAKKQNEIKILNQKNDTQRMMMYLFLAGFLVISLLALFLFRLFRAKQKANAIIESKNNELQSANDEIIKSHSEIESQNTMLTKQKEQITDSIRYAQKIQEALLPSSELLEEAFPDHFVFFKPLDIVSGDFYWAKQINNVVYFAAADCTGHGVPGAFMSMLGITFLNDIVNEKSMPNTGEVLDTLREKIKLSLKQKGETFEQKDGMDISLCSFNLETKKLQFSGAYNAGYIVRKVENNIEISNDIKVKEYDQVVLLELKANRQPVAIFYEEKPFNTIELDLLEGDMIYLLSDGFPDQFGGPDDKKYSTKNMKKLFTNIHNHSAHDQLQVLINTLDIWQEGTEQVDDVLVIGIKV